MGKLLQILLGMVWLSVSAHASASVVLTVESGQLVSARGVEVDGRVLDVTFTDGTCAGLFDGCDDPLDFFFGNDSLGAQAASDALGALVFQDGPLGTFDKDPELTNGCTSTGQCLVFTPWSPKGGGEANAWVFSNGVANADAVYASSLGSTVGNSNAVWAVWSESVPAPQSLLLTALGLGLMGATRHRKRKTAAV